MKFLELEASFEDLVPLMQDSFNQGLSVTLRITGNSMLPLFRHGRDSVTLSRCDPSHLKRGDVPLYRRDNGQYVLHRILRVRGKTLTIAGDAQRRPEVGVPVDHVLAVMTSYVRKGKPGTCRDIRYRLYTSVWMLLRPVRPYVFKIHALLHGGRT